VWFSRSRVTTVKTVTTKATKATATATRQTMCNNVVINKNVIINDANGEAVVGKTLENGQ